MSRRKRDGLDEMLADLEDFRDNFPQRLKRNMDRAMASFTMSLRDTMPVRTGALKASGSWDSDLSSDEYSASVEFGGPTAPYAPYVIGRFVNGEHAWDDVLPAFEPIFEAAIADALAGDDR